MYFQEKFIPDTATESNTHQTTHSEIKVEPRKIDSLIVPDVAICLVSSIGFVASGIVFFLMLPKIRTVIENKTLSTSNDLDKLPCKNCQYFNSNHYIKCAVQPCMVMTEEATNCPDYSAVERNQKKFFK